MAAITKVQTLTTRRGALMGAAMIIIMMFHVGMPRASVWYGLCRLGNLGVDVFLFLSGIGLWYSWEKASLAPSPLLSRWTRFYSRRLRRIYPTWLVVAAAFYIPRFFEAQSRSLSAWTDLCGDVLLNWDFWLNDELTFWYVPATMMLYIFAPPYMELLRRDRVWAWLVAVPLLWCIAVQYVTPIHQAVGHIEIFWSRVPVFFLGLNAGAAVKRGVRLNRDGLLLAALPFVASLALCYWLEQYRHGRFPLFLERMAYIPFAVTLCLLLGHALERAPGWLCRSLAWIGGISLEIYMLHAEFIMKPVRAALHTTYWPTLLLTVALSLPAAWLLKRLVTAAEARVAKTRSN